MQIKDGQRLIDRLRAEGIEVSVAGWLKESDSGDWYLYLATPLVGAGGAKRQAYHRVNAVMRGMEEDGLWVDPFEIKVIGPHDPIAKDMARESRRRSKIPTRFGPGRLGELLYVDDGFIYPPTANSSGEPARGNGQ
jgi:hypothetical protein